MSKGRNTSNGMTVSFESKELERFHRCRRIIVSTYVLHWTIVLVILTYGMLQNGGDRKFVPVDPKGLVTLVQNELDQDFGEASCLKAYVDVHSLSIKDDIAFVCCTKQGPYTLGAALPDLKQYQSKLCDPRVPYFNVSMQILPFSKRLTRFPEAWILPLLPILIRLVYQLMSSIIILLKPVTQRSNRIKSPSIGSGLSSSSSSTVLEKVTLTTSGPSAIGPNTNATPQHERIRVTFQRALFYFILLNIRGWGLYIGANAIEDYAIVPWLTGNKVISPLRTDSVSDVEHNIQSSNHDCWYEDVLKAHHRNEMESKFYSDCYGRPFDFSDHIVLFLAHYLPIFVMESIYCWMFPFWVSTQQQSRNLRWFTSRACNALCNLMFLYMHVIVLHATYQTTAYFHTSAEIIVGYIITWILQLPVFYLLCYEKWSILRQFVGLPNDVLKESRRGKAM
ncbi:hypothetical protein ACHAWO_012001 [Cyclotella atomus]|jgi:hypothetical protein|uniref:Uncharacterized protein n=1 Tax=Cyclotella atomus TaxID=382360 RepID=A0ABD3QF50_9STRA